MRCLIYLVMLALAGSGISFNLSAQEAAPDAEFVNIIKEYRLDEDGSIETRYVKELKILTHFAFHSLYGETFVVYDPRYQKLTIREAYTVMADGKKVMAPSNAFNEVLPRFASNFPNAVHLREMVITHTGLEVGAIIHLDYTIRTEPGYYPALMAKEVLATSSPIVSLVVTVDIPESSELHYKMLHLRTGPDIVQENGRKKYLWSFSNLPARSVESFQPTDFEYLPTLMFSTGRDFREVFSGWAGQEAFQWKVNNEMKERVALIRSQQTDPYRMAFDIQRLVADEFSLFDVPPELNGFRVGTAADTWRSNGGTDAEKSVLLCALLKEAGIQANLFAVIPEVLMDDALGCLPAIRGFVVEASPGTDGTVMLSAVRSDDQNLMAELAGQYLIPVDPNAAQRKVMGTKGAVRAEFTLQVDTLSKLSGIISAGFKGAVNPFPALARDPDYGKNLWNSFASAGSVRSCETLSASPEQSSLTWKIECTSAFKQQDEYLFLEIPSLKNGFSGWQMNYLSASRSAPLNIPYPIEESYSLSLELPAHLELITPAGQYTVTNPSGGMTIKIAVKKRTVLITRELLLNVQEITPQLYDGFRTLINEWNDVNKRRLVFRKIQ